MNELIIEDLQLGDGKTVVKGALSNLVFEIELLEVLTRDD
jgi:hypothetical protein